MCRRRIESVCGATGVPYARRSVDGYSAIAQLSLSERGQPVSGRAHSKGVPTRHKAGADGSTDIQAAGSKNAGNYGHVASNKLNNWLSSFHQRGWAARRIHPVIPWIDTQMTKDRRG